MSLKKQDDEKKESKTQVGLDGSSSDEGDDDSIISVLERDAKSELGGEEAKGGTQMASKEPERSFDRLITPHSRSLRSRHAHSGPKPDRLAWRRLMAAGDGGKYRMPSSLDSPDTCPTRLSIRSSSPKLPSSSSPSPTSGGSFVRRRFAGHSHSLRLQLTPPALWLALKPD